jgi:hypothetical protein
MLNDGERQVLAHLEADLCREDPFLAVALLRMCPPQPGRWVRIAYDTVVTLALIETLACLALWQNGTGAACLLAAGLAVAARAARVGRFPPHPRGQRRPPAPRL